jgi:hypothetical protein
MNETTRQVQRSNEGGLRPKHRERSKRAMASPEHLEVLWNDLLSRQPELIRAAYDSLDEQNQKVVFTHLQRMVSETGWQPEQVASAEAAIQALETRSDQGK